MSIRCLFCKFIFDKIESEDYTSSGFGLIMPIKYLCKVCLVGIKNVKLHENTYYTTYIVLVRRHVS